MGGRCSTKFATQSHVLTGLPARRVRRQLPHMTITPSPFRYTLSSAGLEIFEQARSTLVEHTVSNAGTLLNR